MKKLIEFSLPGDETILVEIEDYFSDGVSPASPGEKFEKAKVTFENALKKIKPLTECLIKHFKDNQEKPDKIEISYGLKLNAKSGIILASAGIDANFSVKLQWKNKKQTN